MTTASAPGKIILFGEHAVVYGRPAIAVPVTQVRATVTLSDSTDGRTWIEAPGIGLAAALDELPAANPLAAVIRSTIEAVGAIPNPLPPFAGADREGSGAKIRIDSTIPVASGLGSGAAVSVALARALSAQLGKPLDDEQVNLIAYEAENLHHGTPSGIDNTVITYARPVYFVKGAPIESLTVAVPFTVVIGDTGLPAPTKESVGDLRRLWESDRPRWEAVFDEVGEIVAQARTAIEHGSVTRIGELMNANHALLQEMSVSSRELDRLVSAARAAGAAGAKLSGGGRGGNMIALVEPELAQRVSSALSDEGARRTIISEVSS